MSIAGIGQTIPDYSMAIGAMEAPASSEPASGADMIGARMEASVRVLDMANSFVEDAAGQLIASMNQMTGVGQNIDIRV